MVGIYSDLIVLEASFFAHIFWNDTLLMWGRSPIDVFEEKAKRIKQVSIPDMERTLGRDLGAGSKKLREFLLPVSQKF